MEIEKIEEKLKRLTLFVAYNTDVDAICEVNEDLEELFSEGEYEEAKELNPGVIDGRVDLLSGLLQSMETNDANELPISNREVENILKKNITPKSEKMGGQAGIMSNILSSLGCKVIIYTELLSHKQAEMFRNNGRIFYPLTNQILHFKRPQKCSSNMKTKINWVFEFKEGDRLFSTEASGSNRFIAASRPEEIKLEIGNLHQHAEILAKECDCAILSGFHDLKKKYEDGTTYLDHLKNSGRFIDKLKEGNPDLTIQMEFASTPDREIREDILDKIIPRVDCLSMDRSETVSILRALDNDEREDLETVEGYSRGIREILENTEISCVKIHTFHYFMAVFDNYFKTENVKKGLEFARELAVTKAEEGTVDSIDSLRKDGDYHISEEGLEEKEKLAGILESKTLADSGIHEETGYTLIMIPTKLVENPRRTVGIGDAISSGSFVVENALNEVK